MYIRLILNSQHGVVCPSIMDGDICIEKILDVFDREYERSKAEHIDYFLAERQSIQVVIVNENCHDSALKCIVM